ncbi:AraC family transcriptional regulator [Kitasatospora albolonga]|uniref:helix-turn-helix transcriptional regulator n=1 Tax=Kitasatospora albolonga TaxID=68173 RepID=UPI0031E65865
MTVEFPVHRLQVPEPQVLPFAIGSFDTIGALSRADFPHRHTFYEIVHVTGGRGTHVVDLAHWPLEPPQLYVVAPGQLHHWEAADGLTGQVLLFDEDFLLSHPEDVTALRTLATRPWRDLGPAAGEVAALFRELDREYRTLAEGYAGMLRSYLHILVVRALRAASAATPDGGAAAPGRAAELAAAFGRLIAEPGRSVADCARELGVSPGHLHELVKQATGRTPGRLIRQRQTMRAKLLLARTSLTVRQVARESGFEDPAYFCRFFRRETGMSPGEFRGRAAEPGGWAAERGGERGVGEIHHDPRLPSIASLPDGP